MLSKWPKDTYSVQDIFRKDKSPLNAVLIGYIPDLEIMDLSNFSTQYFDDSLQTLSQIHLAGILHGDPYPGNFMISRERNRVIWIDFELSTIFPKTSTLTKRENGWFKSEIGLVNGFIKALVCDTSF